MENCRRRRLPSCVAQTLRRPVRLCKYVARPCPNLATRKCPRPLACVLRHRSRRQEEMCVPSLKTRARGLHYLSVNAVGGIVQPRRTLPPLPLLHACAWPRRPTNKAKPMMRRPTPVPYVCCAASSLHRDRLRHAPSHVERMTKSRLPTYKKNGLLAQLDTPPRRREIVTREGSRFVSDLLDLA
ncbi:hypothetical protein DAI22_08g092250 [Oryza sativa Japonica Group]|nr:hypothetical protein DAI22_08g092250 [Oryza sativa Japonica Group]